MTRIIEKIIFQKQDESGAKKSIPVSQLTILVGPNSSGKSLTLREIEGYLFGENRSGRKSVEKLEIINPKDIKKFLEPFQISISPNKDDHGPTYVYKRLNFGGGNKNPPEVVVKENVFERLAKSATASDLLERNFLSLHTLFLSGRTRFELIQPKERGNLHSTPASNHLSEFFRNDKVRRDVSEKIYRHFGAYLVVDNTTSANVELRLNPQKTELHVERGASQQSIEYSASSVPLLLSGDGVQCYVSLLVAVSVLPCKILLIDEPEAFLHPPLCRRLGSDFASLAKDREGHMIVATHSSDFLMGCLQSTDDITIVRLTYEGGQADVRFLNPQQLKDLIRDPLLRTSNVLKGLFHKAIIVCEADADRAFYDEINLRLLSVNRGVEDALFLNAQGWHTIERIVSPLRQIGIPAAAVMDLDVLAGGQWSKIESLIDPEYREEILKIFQEWQKKGINSHTLKKGLYNLGNDGRCSTEHLVKELSKYGIFLVPVGELEGWINNLSIIGSTKTEWIVKAFEKMGSDPADAQYQKPADHDVWAFLDSIQAWVSDANRRGMSCFSAHEPDKNEQDEEQVRESA